mmetsp:Transcript_34408/g.79430  ORF Transcript_34408/g.79430 Transcript_34408/m.79430 type:complete len:232 (+) Transcript_34408:62-757(+)
MSVAFTFDECAMDYEHQVHRYNSCIWIFSTVPWGIYFIAKYCCGYCLYPYSQLLYWQPVLVLPFEGSVENAKWFLMVFIFLFGSAILGILLTILLGTPSCPCSELENVCHACQIRIFGLDLGRCDSGVAYTSLLLVALYIFLVVRLGRRFKRLPALVSGQFQRVPSSAVAPPIAATQQQQQQQQLPVNHQGPTMNTGPVHGETIVVTNYGTNAVLPLPPTQKDGGGEVAIV